MAALGTFTLQIDGDRLGGVEETTARVRIKIQNQSAIADPDADKFWFPHESAVKGASVSLPYSVPLKTDVTTGLSTTIGYTVIVDTQHSGQVVRTFAARANGVTVNLADIAAEDPLAPVTDPDATLAALLANDDSAVRDQLDTLYVANLATWPLWTYGNSYAWPVTETWWHTLGKHYTHLVAAALNAGTLNNYAANGTRISDVLSGLNNGSAYPGLEAPVSGATWPGTATRSGLVILDSVVNDVGHYPAMDVTPVVPTAISGTSYTESIRGMYRHALALMSSASRVQQSAATFTGTWTATASTAAYASGGTLAYTTSVGAAASFSITPPQTGPLAGKVFVSVFKLAPAAGTMATVNVQVDGGAATATTVAPWETYTGPSGVAHDVTSDVIPVTLPVDGAAHTILLTHAGSAGHYMYVDDVLIPSEDPNPIAVMGPPATLKSGTWTTAQVNTWTQNRAKVVPVVQEVAAEFGNAFYVPSNISLNGLYSGDGIHPNDRGQQQRASDLANQIHGDIKARLDARALAAAADADFGVV